ncbi:DUF1553 domain-containing protein [Gemmata sp.]|uniref:DUF1553 domain-containing protein n=1 Tax=Gemmata sp. TaxID=1914242 RepID=UPI003F6EEBEC
MRLSGLLVLLAVTPVAADGPKDGDAARAVLRERCVSCHGADKQRGGLRLDARAPALAGGDGGPAIVPGKSGESELVRRVVSADPGLRMPPKGDPLTKDQAAAISKWIDAGAEWPGGDAAGPDPRKQHWAWQPVARPAVPRVLNADWPRNEIDRFVLARLEREGLSPSPEADRRTLIRRLSFDLLGLPPTPERVEAFLRDERPGAYERLVDEFLASPHYGERWARHWLDVAHYADTHGFERDMRRDNAWRYRDWVIRALNADLRYDRFLADQIAGDVARPKDPDAVSATGFLAAGPWDFVGQAETRSEVLRRAARADDLDDMVTQVMTAACGLTVNCARCHDHKIDPISQREYFALTAVFAGVKRADRPLPASGPSVARRAELEAALVKVRADRVTATGGAYDLADIVGGGDGRGTGTPGRGIDPLSGRSQDATRELLAGVKPNTYARSDVRFVDGLVVPTAAPAGTPVTSTGLVVKDVPETSAQVWDAVRNGPVNAQFSTKLGETDYAAGGHTLLGLHANAAVTFDLAALRAAGAPRELTFTATVGYFGKTEKAGASAFVYVDGREQYRRLAFGRDDGPARVSIRVPADARFLTLMATDNGNGISHDQVGFADPWLRAADAAGVPPDRWKDIAALTLRATEVRRELSGGAGPRVYAVESDPPPPVRVHRRGNPEDPQAEVAPGAVSCLPLPAALGTAATPEGERRTALAEWITDPRNPLTRRVAVNRIWHYHFGTGLVDTPSDFGLGGGKPSHPELLDWLAEEFAARRWSVKELHRLVCTSAAYRQSSKPVAAGLARDAADRMLWRFPPRRLEAEAIRDTILAVSGKLNREMHGPGYQDFRYTEAYAPVYEYLPPDAPEVWRRTVYRFAVRTTPHQFLTTLDCPNPANLTPTRSTTTTPLQALALMNNAFTLKQAGYFAARVKAEAGDQVDAQVNRAFVLAFGRPATPAETGRGAEVVRAHGLPVLCRILLNATEFVYVD